MSKAVEDQFLNARSASTRRLPASLRMLWLALILSLTLYAQAAALDPQHEAHEQPDHCCLLCHVGPLSLLYSPAPSPVSPNFELAWLIQALDAAPSHDILSTARSSRAPPLSA